MTTFHATIHDLLEDTYRFLSSTLQNDALSNTSSVHKEKLLSQLKKLQNEYPELQLQFCDDVAKSESAPFSVSSSSPLPYMDMNGGGKSSFFPNNVDKESYDIVIPRDKTDGLENQSVADSEDYASDEAKVLPDVAASDLYACDKAGYLDKKKRESIKVWLNPFQRRWCAIKNGVLYYFEKTSDRKQRGSIILAGYEARIVLDDYKDGKKHNHCFELVCPGKRTYQFSAPSEKDLLQWISAVERNSYTPGIGKSYIRESQCYPSNSPKEAPRINHHVAEDIYEIVDEDDASEKQPTETQSVSETLSAQSDAGTLPVFEESNQLFNYNEWYVGLWDCVTADDSELSFYRGDLIHVVDKEYDGYSWWVGEFQGKIGFVPKSYLMEAYECC